MSSSPHHGGVWMLEHVPTYSGTGEWDMRIKQPKKQPMQGHMCLVKKVIQAIQSDTVILFI